MSPVFSARTAASRHTNRLANALERARDAGRPVLDLTTSNPTRAALPYPETRILSALSDRRALTYAPTPFGLESARDAIARAYDEDGVRIDPSRIVLTASTSEAYGFLFKLLADVGDEVLIPEPSYPLFELLARFEGVKLVPYRLAYDGAWHIDLDTVARAATSRTRAILTVSPNNPTGSYVKQAELEALGALGLPLVSDEVFAPFDLQAADRPGAPRRARSVLESHSAPLVFALNGLSKMAALPQMKLGWIAVGGRTRPASRRPWHAWSSSPTRSCRSGRRSRSRPESSSRRDALRPTQSAHACFTTSRPSGRGSRTRR